MCVGMIIFKKAQYLQNNIKSTWFLDSINESTLAAHASVERENFVANFSSTQFSFSLSVSPRISSCLDTQTFRNLSVFFIAFVFFSFYIIDVKQEKNSG